MIQLENIYFGRGLALLETQPRHLSTLGECPVTEWNPRLQENVL